MKQIKQMKQNEHIEKNVRVKCIKSSKWIYRVLAVLLLVGTFATEFEGIFWASELPKRLYNTEEARGILEKAVQAADEKNWTEFTELMCGDEQSYYKKYFSNGQMDDGIEQIESMDLLHAYEVNNELAESEWLVEEYPLLTYSNEIYSFIIETKCDVLKESQFFFNGINYFLVILAVEGDELKIVQFNRPSSDLITEVVMPKLSEDNKDYDEQVAGMEVIERAQKGLVTNADNEMLSDGFETVTMEQENSIMPLALDPPLINHYTTYHYPTTIKVKLTKTGDGEVVEVDFTEYMINVLPNEWIPSWKSEALKVGAYCVKMVGIYRALNPMSSTGAYHLSQATQYYKPDSAYDSTTAAILSIKNSGMANSSGFLFFPYYAAGTKGEAGAKASGKVRQYGTQYLARQGYTYKEILNYYYSGSEFSPGGDVMIFGYNIGY